MNKRQRKKEGPLKRRERIIRQNPNAPFDGGHGVDYDAFGKPITNRQMEGIFGPSARAFEAWIYKRAMELPNPPSPR